MVLSLLGRAVHDVKYCFESSVGAMELEFGRSTGRSVADRCQVFRNLRKSQDLRPRGRF